jgi:hypothetical protein
LFAVSSLGVYGIILSGWASNSRYAFFGALRSAAQMVSYEVSIGLILISVLLCVGSLNFIEIISFQNFIFFIVPLFPLFLMFLVSILAETNRAPFDLPEAESELVSGYNVEYASMGFALFFLAEYSSMILMSALTVVMFMGEREIATDNKVLGQFNLEDIPSAPRGVPQINVTFQLDVNGLLSVSAREEQSGQEQSIKIEGASTLGREEVSKMLEDAETNAILDKSRKSLVNITYEIDSLLSKTESFLDKTTDLNDKTIVYFTELINQTKDLYKNNKLELLFNDNLKRLKFIYSVLILEVFKKELNETSTSNSSQTSNDSNVIDVTEFTE